MNGIVLLHKPAGMTSFAAVSKCRHILGEKKAGHTGTLDPNATGLLIVLLGRTTKLLPYCVKDHKHYIAEFSLGLCSDTEDIWGNTETGRTPKTHTDAELQEISARFLGEQAQIPPMYSAVRQNGKKLYELARKGIETEREARMITVDRLSLKHIEGDRYGLDAVVSSGTYIRTLIRDIGLAMGEDALMTSLVRTGIESLSLAEAYTFEDLQQGKYTPIEPVRVIDPCYPMLETEDPEAVRNGRPVFLDSAQDIVLLTYAGEVLAAYERREGRRFHCLRGLY